MYYQEKDFEVDSLEMAGSILYAKVIVGREDLYHKVKIDFSNDVRSPNDLTLREVKELACTLASKELAELDEEVYT